MRITTLLISWFTLIFYYLFLYFFLVKRFQHDPLALGDHCPRFDLKLSYTYTCTDFLVL